MSLVALHNGGGVGISKAINGGFGLVLDGSERVDEIINAAIPWDTMIGVARRSWGRCEHSIETVAEYNQKRKGQDYITMPYLAREIAKKIEAELNYPGQIKVNIVRETRAVDYAK